MSTEIYPEPVAQLLTLGETNIHDGRNYLEMGFTREHIPDLIRLVEDEELSQLPVNEDGQAQPQAYAQVHAWRTLAQLESAEAIPAFLGLLDWIDEQNDDFVREEIPIMLGKIGAPAILPCRDYLADRENDVYTRLAAAHALAEIGQRHPESRDVCVRALVSTLDDYESDDETVNGFTLSYLADLKAVEAAPLAEEIFNAGRADEDVAGDYEDYQIKVGLLKKRLTPGKHTSLVDINKIMSRATEFEAGEQRAKEKEKKEKEKRKQEKKARKRHKKH